MSHRNVVILSADQNLVDSIYRNLQRDFSVSVETSTSRAAVRFRQEQPWALVVDLELIRATTPQGGQFLRWLSMNEHSTRIVTMNPKEGDLGTDIDELIRVTATCQLQDKMTSNDLANVLQRLNILDPKRNGTPMPPCRILKGQTRNFITYTPSFFPILDELKLVAAHDVPVLLVGETGSGKTYLSQLLHELSPMHSERFLPVACGTLPPDLIESELFGHVKGAFTSAHADKEGKFSAAGSGTLLLDEIDVLGLDQQSKLLRVIETGEFEPVGSNTTLRSKARLVVASNVELDPLVQSGKFRQDLYYRLNVLKFRLPPLRERQRDLRPLTRQFIKHFAKMHRVSIVGVDPAFYGAIESYLWPGNIRELENAVRRSIILCRTGMLSSDLLPVNVLQAYGELRSLTLQQPMRDSREEVRSNGDTLESFVELTEKEVIATTLQRHKFRRTATARSLGISRVTLYNKMRKYGIPTHKSRQVPVSQNS